jgi:hypothetical protein
MTICFCLCLRRNSYTSIYCGFKNSELLQIVNFSNFARDLYSTEFYIDLDGYTRISFIKHYNNLHVYRNLQH